MTYVVTMIWWFTFLTGNYESEAVVEITVEETIPMDWHSHRRCIMRYTVRMLPEFYRCSSNAPTCSYLGSLILASCLCFASFSKDNFTMFKENKSLL